MLSSPNRIIWEYFDSLRRLTCDAKKAQGTSQEKQLTALAVMMSINVIEVFINIWFQIHIEESTDLVLKKKFNEELFGNTTLHKKIMSWPQKYLSSHFDISTGIGAEIMNLKKLRNEIVHFKSAYETFSVPGVQIHGLANTSAYDELDFNSATRALETVERYIGEVFLMAGSSKSDIPAQLHAWIGRVPV
jgi:hypothetical protein